MHYASGKTRISRYIVDEIFRWENPDSKSDCASNLRERERERAH